MINSCLMKHPVYPYSSITDESFQFTNAIPTCDMSHLLVFTPPCNCNHRDVCVRPLTQSLCDVRITSRQKRHTVSMATRPQAKSIVNEEKGKGGGIYVPLCHSDLSSLPPPFLTFRFPFLGKREWSRNDLSFVSSSFDGQGYFQLFFFYIGDYLFYFFLFSLTYVMAK